MSNIGIKDIAQLAGVGISTVSRVINNSGPVSENTRNKVKDIINEHHFIPNNSARNLKSSQSKNIALLVKGIANPFFTRMIRVIEHEAALRGYLLLIQNADGADEMNMAIQEKQDRNLSGVIIIGGSYAYSDDLFRRLSIPCVLVTISAGRQVSRTLYSSVTINDEQEGYRATDYLISLGHRRIGFIYHTVQEPATPLTLRYTGYLRALKEHNIPFDQKLIAAKMAPGTSGFHDGFLAMKQLLDRNRDMTAVFAFADILAIGAAKAAYAAGLRIPDDISIIGFDGIEMAEYYQPSLDTIYQPAAEMALSGAEILFDMIRGNASRHLVFESVLLKRGSCRKLP
ncbi:LacI family transcriptional regulator [Spirochaetia bacterium]|nr:LacI family transcriptional regulator [Spirochaetia bacterium]